jgi:hypothetical protein
LRCAADQPRRRAGALALRAPRAGGALLLDHLEGALAAEARRVDALGDGGVDLAVGDVGAVAAGEDAQRPGAALDLAELLDHLLARRAGGAAAAAAGRLRLGEELERPVERHVDRLLPGAEAAELVAALDEGPVAAEAGGDLLTALRILADQAGQEDQARRDLRRQLLGRDVGGERHAARLVALAGRRLALEVEAEAAVAQVDRQAGGRVLG